AYLVDRDSLAEFSDVVLDVSSMPRGIYFPILTSLLQHTENMGRDAPNVFVHVCENAALDAAIREQYVDDDAYPVHGFGGHQLTDVSRLPAIWLPAIGSGKRIQLERAHEYVSPEEICPVLPAMSSNLRRADDIIDEYHDLLFDSWQVAHENIILAAERNPLENCRQLIRAGCSYADALRPLGGCRLIFSAFSSKMMSLGVLLAAYAFRYALQVHNAYLVNIEAQGYSIPPNLVQNGIASASEMHMIWLRGDCYADQQ
ncbi:MAG: hypothetical protein GX600_11435, partial [Dehalococcoidia bacterium]|nr:hypothetical protein [Dehalococcoidia bacterium]